VNFKPMRSPLCRRSSPRSSPDQIAGDIDALTDAMHVVGREAAHHRRAVEQGRMDRRRELLGYRHGDFPWLQLLRRALDRSAAAELGARFLPMETQLSGAGPLDASHRIAPGLRANRIRRTGFS